MSKTRFNLMWAAIIAVTLAGSALAAWTWTWRGFTPIRLIEALAIPVFMGTITLLFWIFGKRLMKRREATGAVSPPSHFSYGTVVILGMYGMLAVMQCFAALIVAGLMHDKFEIMVRGVFVTMGLFGVWLGNRRGKLETPWREGAREPFDWQKVQRLRGVVEVVFGFAVAGLSLALPMDLLVPVLLASAVISAVATHLITYRVKQNSAPRP